MRHNRGMNAGHVDVWGCWEAETIKRHGGWPELAGRRQDLRRPSPGAVHQPHPASSVHSTDQPSEPSASASLWPFVTSGCSSERDS